MITKRFQKRKAISTFIATLLLMVLAVAAGVVIYAYTMGYLGSMGSPSSLGSISMDSAALTTSNGVMTLNAYVRNIGKATFTIDSVYVNGIKIAAVSAAAPIVADANGYKFTYPANGNGVLPENGVATLTIGQNPYIDGTQTSALTNGFQTSITYDIKIIGKDNTQLSFQIKG
jgi:hypothetical protein